MACLPRSRFLSPYLLMWTLALLAAVLPQAAPISAPNFLVILLDDVGRDKVRAYGDQAQCQPTPNLDLLASRGVLFRNAWSYSTCSPTRAALLTGRHSDRTGIGSVIRPTDGISVALDPAEIVIPETLPQHTSMALGKWHLSDTGSSLRHPIECGFDAASTFEGANSYYSWTWNLNGTISQGNGYYPAALADQTISVLQRIDQPFFVYYAPRLAHSPFHTPPGSLHTQGNPSSARGEHMAMSESIDTIIGRVLASVDLETTYVFVLGDNGSPLSTVASPFQNGKVKGSPFEGGVRIPMIVAGPGVSQGMECEELVHVTDYMATLRELANLPPVSQGGEDSISFAPLLSDPQRTGARDTLFVHQFPFPGTTGSEFRALRTKRWKLIVREAPVRYQLYDLAIDPHENNDLLISQPGAFTTAIKERLLQLMPTFP